MEEDRTLATEVIKDAPNGSSEMMPVCPGCGMDPAVMNGRGPFELGQLMVMVIFCGNSACRKVWSVNVVGTAQPRLLQPNPRFNGKGLTS